MTRPNIGEQINGLCDLLAEQGDLLDPAWRAALNAVPRHLFAPIRAWAMPDSDEPDHLIDRAVSPAAWWDAVYSDTAIITQIDDGRSDPTHAGTYTSSCSAPGTVMNFLHALALRDDDRVLEIGTGTGWTAALLSHRVGADQVTSIEIDAQVSEQAAANLAATGYAPHLIVGNGAAGWPEAGPYDRVHAACGVTSVPYAWVEQTRPGGVIVCPWTPAYGNGQLARLTVTGDGRAIGTFPHFANYMMLRSQRVSHDPIRAFVGGTEEQAVRTETSLDPRTVAWDSYAADLVIGALVPGVSKRMCAAEDGSGEWTFWLLEAITDRDRSWASVDYEPGVPRYLVEQYGPRRLWDEVENAYLRWVSWGRPARDRFGLTVAPDGERLWLDDPTRVIG
ncbi:protein-L-isoaspartate(D-aspartate) O-methyltransferase [Actinomadura craniellae]|uniref:Protein-L-isoaspartate O-methyltransferase n=1 Tax=Actinomadura craniellae TaxID=2231787 RepID=A0A365GZE6_9ACTN|nr:methyltransferase domain-containing protein [Actinomadura craniellae]RAY12192.1 protein-L-isoaspartate(D-aspartate) O-methyltransferase [Actinomadura craniellae]